MLRKILLSLGMKALGKWIREVAEGKHGQGLQNVYLSLQGWKTLIGVALGGAAAALLAMGLVEPAGWIGTVGALLVSVGLADKAWRSAPASWTEQAWYRFLRDHWADVVAVGAAATAALTTCEGTTAAIMARLHLSCGTGIAVVAFLLAFTGWLVGEGKLATAPKE
jgi:hypothetical protein